MITSEKVQEAMEGYNNKLKIINDCIEEEMSRPIKKRRGLYLVFLERERAIYEFTNNELEKLSNEK